MKNALSVIFEWHCCHCANVERVAIPARPNPLTGYELPNLTLPDGWRIVNGDAYCYRHEVTPWVKVKTERGPQLEGNRAA